MCKYYNMYRFLWKLIFLLLLYSCQNSAHSILGHKDGFLDSERYVLFDSNISTEDWSHRISEAAISIIDPNIKYVADYITIPYPNGDVSAGTGVCTDVIIRTYRKLGVDLQQLVHEDMRKNFKLYPQLWGLNQPDRNIDHRRVPNLMTFFTRFGKSLGVSNEGKDYKPGDIVTWVLDNNLTHIGVVINRASNDGKRPLIVHNIGRGQIAEDCLFKYNITGHYRYRK